MTLDKLRRALLAVLLFGTAGMLAELLLLGHIDGAWQWIPVALLGCGCLAMTWQLVRPSAASLQLLRVLMLLFLVSGIVGLGLHFKGNVEFEREMYPALAGWQLFKQAITGATPALAPGTMSVFGLLGWLYTFRKDNSPVGGKS
jgi:hypothetical protein